MSRIEFWPDYSEALLFTDRGEPVDVDTLALPGPLVASARGWLRDYDDSKLPWETTRDESWLSEGRRLFAALQTELAQQGIELVAGEDYWVSTDAVPRSG